MPDRAAYFTEVSYEKYLKRAQYYKNLFDKQTGFMRPKQNGNWIEPFAPNEVTFHFTEGNSWVYSFFVPHDVSGLLELYGGKANFAKKLDELFTTEQKLAGREQPDITGLIGQYAHGNEPSHHIAYLYNYAGEPWKTQSYVSKILDEFYKPHTRRFDRQRRLRSNVGVVYFERVGLLRSKSFAADLRFRNGDFSRSKNSSRKR